MFYAFQFPTYEFTVDVLSPMGVLRFVISCPGPELRRNIMKKFPTWREAYYTVDDDAGRVGRSIRRKADNG